MKLPVYDKNERASSNAKSYIDSWNRYKNCAKTRQPKFLIPYPQWIKHRSKDIGQVSLFLLVFFGGFFSGGFWPEILKKKSSPGIRQNIKIKVTETKLDFFMLFWILGFCSRIFFSRFWSRGSSKFLGPRPLVLWQNAFVHNLSNFVCIWLLIRDCSNIFYELILIFRTANIFPKQCFVTLC